MTSTPGVAAQMESDLGVRDEEFTRIEKNFGIPIAPNYDDTRQKWDEFKAEIKIYSKDMLNVMKNTKVTGQDLWIEFTCSFTERTIKALPCSEQSYWIKHLLENGVGIKPKRGYARWKVLSDALKWTEFRPTVGGTSSNTNTRPTISNTNAGPSGNPTLDNLHNNMRNLNMTDPSVPQRPTLNSGNLNEITPRNTHQGRIYLGGRREILPHVQQSSESVPPNNRTDRRGTPSYGLNYLMKAYSNRQKFSGSFTEDFEGCIQQYETLCSLCGLDENEMSKGFPIMLTGAAFAHYSRKYARENLSYREVLDGLRAWYTSEEQRHRLLHIWQKPSLSKEMESHPDKSEVEVFSDLADRLTKIQHQLHSSYHEDRFLRDQLLVAADLPSLRRSLVDKIPRTAQEAMQRIASLLSSEPRSAGANVCDEDASVMYSLGHKYHGKARRKFPSKRNSSHQLRKMLAAWDGCWVCPKNHKARFHHTPEEIRKALEDIKRKYPNALFSLDHIEDLQSIWVVNEQEEEETEPNIEIDESDDPSVHYVDEIDKVDCDRKSEVFFANVSFVHGLSFTENFDNDLEKQFSVLTAYSADENFGGVILDTGANRRSIMSIRQYEIYCSLFHRPTNIDLEAKGNVLGLGGSVESVGMASIPIPFKELELVIHVKFRLMENDCPSLLSLKDMIENHLDISIQGKYLTYNGKRMKLSFKNGFLVHQWSPTDICFALYSEKELRRMHRVFGHPTVGALSKLLRRANPNKFDNSTRHAIEDITNMCSICQKHSSKPRRFKVTIGSDDLRFNHIIAVDIMYIQSMAVLHIVDEATHYSTATFMRSHTAEDTWKAILRCWIRIYLGPPDFIRIDQGTNFVAKQFKESAEAEGITVLEAPVESANTMSHVERYHAPLRVAYEKIRDSLPKSESNSDCLQLAVKAVNDTIGPEGLCPTLLVFGAIPKPPRLGRAETQVQRARALDKALDAVHKEQSKRRIAFALKHPCSPKAKENEDILEKLPSGSPVLVYRMTSKKWEGPYPLVHVYGRTAVIQLPRGRKIFRSTAVKSAKGVRQDNTWTQAERAESAAAVLLHTPEEMLKCHETAFTCNDNTHDFRTSRQMELDDLKKREVFKVVDRNIVPPGMRIYGTKWVDSIKTVAGKKIYKSRLVAQNFRDYAATSISTSSPTVSRCGQRIAIATAALHTDHTSYVRDISQAYVQSTTTLERPIYLRPPAEMGLQDPMILLAIKPLYGIPESGLHWFTTYHSHHTNMLHMQETRADKCVLVRRTGTQLQGLSALQVDDSYGFGDSKFLEEEETHSKKFQAVRSKPRKLLSTGDSTTFNGCTISILKNHRHLITQTDKIQSIKEVTTPEEFKSTRAALQYIGTCSRPDICAAVQLLACNADNPSQEDIKALNKVIRWCKETASVGISSIPLDMASLSLGLYTDASFANAVGLKSQIGFAIVVLDNSGKANLLHYGSTKCQRIARSVMAAEIFALVHGFDQAYVVQSMMNDITGSLIPIDAYIDSKTAFNVVVKHAPTLEKRLQIDVNGIRQSFGRGDLRNVTWISGNTNIADGLTKGLINSDHVLWKLLTHNSLPVQRHGWVQRSITSTTNIDSKEKMPEC